MTGLEFDHAGRRARLAGVLALVDADAALVTGLANIRYLTGLASSNAALLVPRPATGLAGTGPAGTGLLATDGRYAEQAAASCPDVDLVVARDPARALLERAAAAGARVVAVETHVLTVDAFGDLADATPARLVPLGRAVEALRAVKDPGEVALLRSCARLADRALAGLLVDGGVRPGRTERDVAADLEARMRALGAEAPAFETIVASGPRGALPHARPSDRPLAPGDLVVLDFGARIDGYHSDCTRTVVLGPAAQWQRDLHALVAAAQAAGIAALRPGAEGVAVDAAARAVVDDAGHGEHYPHGLGHGVGLEVHEAPGLGPTVPGRLPSRAVVTVEPGVYLPGRGGVRTEDLLVVSDAGPELLTTSPAELLVLG
jgi:Xaa-Pro aminopeptidase